MKKRISVVGAVIVRDGQILCAQRGESGSLPGLWEFPGGKIEPGENAETALRREIGEELGCEIDVGALVEATEHEYAFATIHLVTFFCELVSGEPVATEHADLRWLTPEGLPTLHWAAADIPAVQKIRSLLSHETSS